MTREELLAKAQQVFQDVDAPAREAREAADAEALAMRDEALARLGDFTSYFQGIADVQLARAQRIIQREYEAAIAGQWELHEALAAADPDAALQAIIDRKLGEIEYIRSLMSEVA